MIPLRVLPISLAACAALLAPAIASAEQSFPDVPPAHPAYAAVEYLKSVGVLQGYEDGTFKPNQPVGRHEAVKIIVTPLVPAEALAQLTSSSYTDVPAGSWFLPTTEAAFRVLRIIDGPPKSSQFRPTATVKKAEFLKMLELGSGVDPASSYAEIRTPLALDVTNADEWYYPYIRYAVASSMTQVTAEGMLSPGRELTRADVALLLHRFLMYREGRRTQALLSETETEIVNVLKMLEGNDVERAELSANRAFLAARGALTSQPEESIVKGAVKIAEGFQTLVAAYKAGKEGRLDDAIALSKEAWELAARAKEFNASLATVATQMQTIASNMAAEARKLQGQ